MTKSFYKEYRCPHDNKLLFKGVLVDSIVEVKCKGCGNLVELTGEKRDNMICKKIDCANRV